MFTTPRPSIQARAQDGIALSSQQIAGIDGRSSPPNMVFIATLGFDPSPDLLRLKKN